MSTIYIVVGSTGEYSDLTNWNVCAFTSELAALERILKLDELMQKCIANVTVEGFSPVGSWASRQKAVVDAMRSHPDGDPDFRYDYPETSYYYSACELVPS